MKLPRWVLCAAAAVMALLMQGCLERKLIIRTDPPGAKMLIDGVEKGLSPIDEQFIHYGTREIICMKDGYKTLMRDEKIKKPFYQWFILDFFSEIMPFTIENHFVFEYTLEKIETENKDELLRRADEVGKLLENRKD